VFYSIIGRSILRVNHPDSEINDLGMSACLSNEVAFQRVIEEISYL
jgi:hypothetical protein